MKTTNVIFIPNLIDDQLAIYRHTWLFFRYYLYILQYRYLHPNR